MFESQPQEKGRGAALWVGMRCCVEPRFPPCPVCSPLPPAHSWAAGACRGMVLCFVTHLLCSWCIPQLAGMSHSPSHGYVTWTSRRENPRGPQGCSTSGHIRRRIPRRFCRQSHNSECLSPGPLLLGRKKPHSSVPTSVRSREPDKYPQKSRWLCTVSLSVKQKLSISSG